MRIAPPITLTESERAELERWVALFPSSHRLAIRARVILEASGGRTNGEIARVLGIHSETVTRWRRRFVVNRLEGLRRDAPRSGARPRTSPDLVDRIVRTTLEESPPGRKRWTTRSLARSLHVNHMLVHRVWKARGLAQPLFVGGPAAPGAGQPWVDVVGVYLDAPAAAVVFAVGVRDSEPVSLRPRADPSLSGAFLLPNAPAAITGLLTRGEEFLSRVPNPRQSPSELLVFLRNLEERTPGGTSLEVVFDRPLEFVSERVSGWLKGHPRFRVYTPPAGSSWVAAVDSWISAHRDLTLHPDSFRSVSELTGSVPVGTTQPIVGRFAWSSPLDVRLRQGPSTTPRRTPRRTPTPAPDPGEKDRVDSPEPSGTR